MTVIDMNMFTETEAPTEFDTVPPSPDVTDPCSKCGRQIDVAYSGRGPRPKKCSECKVSRATATRKGPGATGNNVTLAQQATEALWQINGVGAFLAMLTGYKGTAAAIQAREGVFREMCYNALLTDPGMCRYILKGGMQSAKVSLMMCYGMFAAGIVPVFMEEKRERKAARLAEQDAADNTVQFPMHQVS